MKQGKNFCGKAIKGIKRNGSIPIWKKKRKTAEDKDTGSFVGFVLLSEPIWDKGKFIADFIEDWGIHAANVDEDADDKTNKGTLLVEQGNMCLAISFISAPIPNGEAKHYAAANYMWPKATEITKSHKAQILITVLGEKSDLLIRGKLFTKACATCLKQRYAVGIYTDGAVFEPTFYREFAMLMKQDELPIMDWVWFGIHRSEKRVGIYTYGMHKFGKDEMEVYVDKTNADLNEIRFFMMRIVSYVLEHGQILRDGETIGFTANQKLTITKSKGIALDRETLKIEYRT